MIGIRDGSVAPVTPPLSPQGKEIGSNVDPREMIISSVQTDQTKPGVQKSGNRARVDVCRRVFCIVYRTTNENHTGSVTINSLPFPSSLVKVSVPPRASTIVLLM